MKQFEGYPFREEIIFYPAHFKKNVQRSSVQKFFSQRRVLPLRKIENGL